jgi:hypothetical protein
MLARRKSLSVALAEKKPNEPSITAEKPKPKSSQVPCLISRGFFSSATSGIFHFFERE